MASIDVTVSNPADTSNGPATLVFTGQNNTLEFSFSNTVGMPSFGTNDSITINFPVSLLTQVGNIEFTKDSNWACDAKGNGVFVLTPTVSIPFTGSINVSFSNIYADVLNHGDLVISYNIPRLRIEGSTVKLVVSEPLGKGGELTNVIDFKIKLNEQSEHPELKGNIYASPSTVSDNGKEVITVPISNEIDIVLTYSGNNLVESWPSATPPEFIVSFSYGTRNNDLTDDEVEMLPTNPPTPNPDYNALTTAHNIAGSNDSTSMWQAQGPDPAGAPSWKFFPTAGNQNLFNNNGNNNNDYNNTLNLIFTHVVSVLPKGDATVFISWGNIPGYNSGIIARPISRIKATPAIKSFATSNGELAQNLNFGVPLVLSWDIFAAPLVTLCWNQNICKLAQPLQYDPGNLKLVYTNQIEIIPVTTDFYLSPPASGDQQQYSQTQQAGPVSISVNNFQGPVLSSFTGTVQLNNGNFQLLLQWQITNLVFETYCSINDDGNQYPPTPNSRILPLDKDHPLVPSQTLQAIDPTSGLRSEKLSYQVDISSFKPVISSFNAEIQRGQNGQATLILSWLAEFQNLEVYCTINDDPTQHPGSDGNGQPYQLAIPLSADTPVKPQYVLTAYTPIILASSSSTVTTNFNNISQSLPVPENYKSSYLVLSPDGKQLLALYENTANNELAAVCFNPCLIPSAMPAIQQLTGLHKTGDLTGLCISPDNNTAFVSMSQGADVTSFQLNQIGKPAFGLSRFNVNNSNGASEVALMPDGSKAWVACGNSLKSFDPNHPGGPISTVTSSDSGSNIACVGISCDGKYLFAWSTNGNGWYFDPSNPPANLGAPNFTNLPQSTLDVYKIIGFSRHNNILTTPDGWVYFVGFNPNNYGLLISYLNVNNMPQPGSNLPQTYTPNIYPFEFYALAKDSSFLFMSMGYYMSGTMVGGMTGSPEFQNVVYGGARGSFYGLALTADNSRLICSGVTEGAEPYQLVIMDASFQE